MGQILDSIIPFPLCSHLPKLDEQSGLLAETLRANTPSKQNDSSVPKVLAREIPSVHRHRAPIHANNDCRMMFERGQNHRVLKLKVGTTHPSGYVLDWKIGLKSQARVNEAVRHVRIRDQDPHSPISAFL
jgi:hypothetical protein